MVRLVILRISESYFRHRWLYLFPIILMWIAAGITVSRDPLYLARGVMHVEQESVLASLTSVQDTTISWETPADRTRNEISELLQTDAFVRAVIQETDLEVHMSKGSAAVAQTMSDARESVWANALGRNQVSVTAMHTNPEITYQLVNAVIENYTLWKVNASLVENITAKAFYNDLLEQYGTDLEISRRELENYLVAHPEPVRDDRSDIEQLEIERLQFEFESANSHYADTLTLRDDAELALSLAESSVRQTYFFIDAPRIPEEPAISLTDIAMQLIIYTIVGFILSIIGIIGAMLLDRSFRFPIDVQYGVSLPVIATVPNAKVISEH